MRFARPNRQTKSLNKFGSFLTNRSGCVGETSGVGEEDGEDGGGAMAPFEAVGMEVGARGVKAQCGGRHFAPARRRPPQPRCPEPPLAALRGDALGRSGGREEPVLGGGAELGR